MVFRKRERRPLKRGGGETGDEEEPPLTTVRTLDDTLLIAIDDGNVESVKKIIEENPGLDLNKEIYNWEGDTFLTFTISREGNNKDKIVNLLLEKGADPNVTYQRKLSPLAYAVMMRPTEMTWETVRILLENPYKKADPNMKDGELGMTPLMWAVTTGDTDFLELLLKNNADTTLTNIDNETALDIAVRQKLPKIIELLKSYNNTITGGKIRTRRRKMKNSCKKRKTRTRKSKKIKK